MELNEDVIAELCDEIEDLIEPSAQRDYIWHTVIVPLAFASFQYFGDELHEEEKNIIAALEACYRPETVDVSLFSALDRRIGAYKDYIEKTDFLNMLHRYLLAGMRQLAYYPLTQEDWDNGPLWLMVSGWLQSGIPLEWIYNKLDNCMLRCKELLSISNENRMKTPQERLIKHVGSDLTCLCIDSDNLAEDIRFVIENRIESIDLNHRYTGTCIDFLEAIPFIKELHMGACPRVVDFQGLKYLSDLEELIIDPHPKCKVDLSAQTNLQFLSFEYNPRMTGFEKLTNLRRMWVWKGTPDFFKKEIFSGYRNLKELGCTLSKIDNLEFLKDCPLEEISFYYNYKQFSLKGLEYQKNLQILKFMSCRKVTDIECLSALTSLRQLLLTDAFSLPSCHIIKEMKQLEALTLSGSSFFEDGDLMPVADLIKELKYNYISQRKNYNIRVRSL